MSLWKYKYFLDVVELKSFTKAGARNYVTQTAVSQQHSGRNLLQDRREI